jgi:ADP-heptose:LPS heptosyltransferase/GT2 family glycosyltransferase
VQAVDTELPVPSAIGSSDDAPCKLFIDDPAIFADHAAEIVHSGLVIEGWALARDGVASIEIYLDEEWFDRANFGGRREDIAATFPDWPGSLLSGFGVAIPPSALSNGKHVVRIELLTAAGRSTARQFAVDVEHQLAPTGPWALRQKMPATEIKISEHVLSGLQWHPHFVIFLRIEDLEKDNLAMARTLASLRDQVYRDWRIVLLLKGPKPQRPLAHLVSEDFADIADRIDFAPDIDGATLAALAVSPRTGRRPDLIAIVSSGDVLGCDAFLELAMASGLHPEAEFFYGDERRINPESGELEAFFKPDWSPELLLATNYIGRLWCVEPDLLDRVGASLEDWQRYGDYDLLLRCAEVARGVHHLPKVIAQRADDSVDDAGQEKQALERALRRRDVTGTVKPGLAPGSFRVQRRVPGTAMVSIIIPTCASRGLVKTCIETLRAVTRYRNFEIICIENIPSRERTWKNWLRQNADKVIATKEPFNWSRFNNLAAQRASGEFLLFLNDDIEIVDPGWLEALLEYGEQPEVGVVGARLLYPDRKVQHAGMFWSNGRGRHAFRYSGERDVAYFGLAQTPRNVIAVTGACLLARRSEFDALGGFDEKHNVVNNDVDYCLRVQRSGKRIVYTPYATLIHHELASRSALSDEFDNEAFERSWGNQLKAGDPFYHPSLTRYRDDYSLEAEPIELVYSGHPLFTVEEIRRILVVKLDHIGDFVIAIPALRRLSRHFPKARLTVLGPPSISSFEALLPEIHEIINFEFFHTRSGLGQKELTREDFVALWHQLTSHRFDLAIDLRKAPETRSILQWTGARWLAGFDYQGQFPWLDIALEWEQDRSVVRKRTHVGDDLLHLVDAVANAANDDREALLSPPSGLLPMHANGRSPERRLVCIHPGVGSAIRQWPVEHYAALIDLLVVNHDVTIAVIGAPEEAEIADSVIEKVGHREAVKSLIGEVKLSELPALLATAALYVGNNSGPKHIAAALGVPTVGIHSGTVDAREWGPMGVNALAVRRDVHCSPCYLATIESCPRKLACLTELRPTEVYEICARLLAIAYG